MKKIIASLSLIFLLNGCAESLALLGPASTAVGGGNVVQSAVTSAASYGVKKQTGLSPIEHVSLFAENNNPEKKREKCVEFLEATNSEMCRAIKNKVSSLKQTIKTKSKIKNLN